MRRSTASALLIAAILGPGQLRAQWRVAVEPPTAGRAAAVTAVARERSDTTSNTEETVSLVIRCMARELDAFITTRDQLESDMAGDVRVRVESDSVRFRDARWAATKTNTGAFIPSPELRVLIRRRVLRVPEVRITISTLKRGRVTYVFPVDDFQPALEALRDACPNDRGGTLPAPGR